MLESNHVLFFNRENIVVVLIPNDGYFPIYKGVYAEGYDYNLEGELFLENKL